MWKVAFLTVTLLALANANFYEELTVKQLPEIMKQKPKWIAGYNKALAGKTEAELRQLLGAKMDKNYTGPVMQPTVEPSGIPATFDARTNWPNCPLIGHIRNQGQCGSCWAVSSSAVMGDRACIKSNGAAQLSLAAEDVLGCCQQHISGCGNCEVVTHMTLLNIGIQMVLSPVVTTILIKAANLI